MTRIRPSLRPNKTHVYVEAIARCGSIRKAAESLHIASSALNRRVLELEEEIGTQLFERLPRGVRLTSAGELYLNYVYRAFAEIELVNSQIEDLQGLVRGKINIAATESVAGNFLPNAIADFQASHPKVIFRVTIVAAEQLLDLLATDSADLMLTHNLFNHNNVSILAEVQQSYCVVVARNHPLARMSNLKLRDCIEYPIALPDGSMAGRALIDMALHKASFNLDPMLVSNSVEVMRAYAIRSQAICFQYKVGAIASKDVVTIPLQDRLLSDGKLYLTMRRGRTLSGAAIKFSEHLAAALQKL